MIDYAALAARCAEHAALHDSLAAHSDEQRVWADDLRTVVSLLRGMAEAKPLHFVMSGDSWVEISPEMQARFGADRLRTLYTHPAPQSNPVMLESHRRQVEQAIHEAEHPSGMSTHDGRARIDASVLRRMLAIIDAPQPFSVDGKRTENEPTEAQIEAATGKAWDRFELAMNAARYRCLRDNGTDFEILVREVDEDGHETWVSGYPPNELDAAVDAALAVKESK